MESPVPPCGSGVYHKVTALYFFIVIYIVQLYKENWTVLDMLGCWAIALPSTKGIVKLLMQLKSKVLEQLYSSYMAIDKTRLLI